MNKLIIFRSDINSELHPNMFNEMLEQFGLRTDADELHITVSSAKTEPFCPEPKTEWPNSYEDEMDAFRKEMGWA